MSMLFRVLGPLEAHGDHGPIRIKGRRPRALMSILLLNPDRMVTLPALVDGVWADNPPASAIANIRTYVHGLRQLLIRAGDRVTRVVSHPYGYHVEAGPDELDLLRFRSLAADGRDALRRGEPARGADLLSQSLSQWRGRPLADVPDVGTVVSARALALEEQRWAVALQWVEASLILGRYEQPIPLLRQMIAERPLCEQTRRHLILALHAVGRTAEALAAYREARRTSIDELGVEPGIELQQMQLEILHGRLSVHNERSTLYLPVVGASQPRLSREVANGGRWPQTDFSHVCETW